METDRSKCETIYERRNFSAVPPSLEFKNPFLVRKKLPKNSAATLASKSQLTSQKFGPKLFKSKVISKVNNEFEPEPEQHFNSICSLEAVHKKTSHDSNPITDRRPLLPSFNHFSSIDDSSQSSVSIEIMYMSSFSGSQRIQNPSGDNESEVEMPLGTLNKAKKEKRKRNICTDSTMEVYKNVVRKLTEKEEMTKKELKEICLGKKNKEGFSEYFVYRTVENYIFENH